MRSRANHHGATSRLMEAQGKMSPSTYQIGKIGYGIIGTLPFFRKMPPTAFILILMLPYPADLAQHGGHAQNALCHGVAAYQMLSLAVCSLQHLHRSFHREKQGGENVALEGQVALTSKCPACYCLGEYAVSLIRDVIRLDLPGWHQSSSPCQQASTWTGW